jgi:hypothetical protein
MDIDDPEPSRRMELPAYFVAVGTARFIELPLPAHSLVRRQTLHAVPAIDLDMSDMGLPQSRQDRNAQLLPEGGIRLCEHAQDLGDRAEFLVLPFRPVEAFLRRPVHTDDGAFSAAAAADQHEGLRLGWQGRR